MKHIVIGMALATVIAIFTSVSHADEECSWTDMDCFARDMDYTVEGTWGEPLVKPFTNELRDKWGDGDLNTPSSNGLWPDSPGSGGNSAGR